jgi:hypothetical protein
MNDTAKGILRIQLVAAALLSFLLLGFAPRPGMSPTLRRVLTGVQSVVVALDATPPWQLRPSADSSLRRSSALDRPDASAARPIVIKKAGASSPVTTTITLLSPTGASTVAHRAGGAMTAAPSSALGLDGGPARRQLQAGFRGRDSCLGIELDRA